MKKSSASSGSLLASVTGDQPARLGLQRPHQIVHHERDWGPRCAVGLRGPGSTDARPSHGGRPTAQAAEESGGVQIEGSRRAVLSGLTAFFTLVYLHGHFRVSYLGKPPPISPCPFRVSPPLRPCPHHPSISTLHSVHSPLLRSTGILGVTQSKRETFERWMECLLWAFLSTLIPSFHELNSAEESWSVAKGLWNWFYKQTF